MTNAEYQLRSLWGLDFFHPVSGRHPAAVELAQRFYTVAANQSDLDDQLIGERMIGVARGDVITELRLLRAAFEELGEANAAFPVPHVPR